jgi:sensory rhodopsin
MVESIVWFGIGAGVFFLATFAFLVFSVVNGVGSSPYYLLPPLDTAVAGTAYVVLTLVAAGSLPDIVGVELVRHLDWVISTPIIAYYLALVAGASARTRLLIVAADVAMILINFVSVTFLDGIFQWIGFGIATIPFIGFIYLLTNTLDEAATRRLGPSGSEGLFRSLRDLTVFVWAIYPLVWLLGPGLGVVLPNDVNFLFMFLDLTAKVGFMGIIFTRQYALDTLRRSEGEGALAAD